MLPRVFLLMRWNLLPNVHHTPLQHAFLAHMLFHAQCNLQWRSRRVHEWFSILQLCQQHRQNHYLVSERQWNPETWALKLCPRFLSLENSGDMGNEDPHSKPRRRPWCNGTRKDVPPHLKPPRTHEDFLLISPGSFPSPDLLCRLTTYPVTEPNGRADTFILVGDSSM